MPPLHQCSKGPANDLYKAAKNGFTKRIDAMLARGIDINDSDLSGLIPLMISAHHGHSHTLPHIL